MRKNEIIEGNAFTRRRRQEASYDVGDDAEMAAFSEHMERFVAWGQDPWASHRRRCAEAQDSLAAERASVAADYKFKPREDVGWYLERLVMLGRLVEHHIGKNSPSWAAYEAAHFGETWAEMQLLICRGDLYCKAVEVRALQATSKPRKHAGRRVERWRHYFELTGKKTEADRLAAEELGDGESTVRMARRAWEKAAAASD